MKKYEVKEECFAIEVVKEEGELSMTEAKDLMTKFLADKMTTDAFEKMMAQGGPSISIEKFLDTEELAAGDKVKVNFRYEDGKMFRSPIGSCWTKVARVLANTAEGLLIEDLETYRQYIVDENDILYKVD